MGDWDVRCSGLILSLVVDVPVLVAVGVVPVLHLALVAMCVAMVPVPLVPVVRYVVLNLVGVVRQSAVGTVRG